MGRIVQTAQASLASAGCSRRDARRFVVSTCYPPNVSWPKTTSTPVPEVLLDLLPAVNDRVRQVACLVLRRTARLRAKKAYPRTYMIARPRDRSCLSCLSTVVPHTADPHSPFSARRSRGVMSLACDGHVATPLRADRDLRSLQPTSRSHPLMLSRGRAGAARSTGCNRLSVDPCSLRGLSLCNGGSHNNHPLPAGNKGLRAKGG